MEAVELMRRLTVRGVLTVDVAAGQSPDSISDNVTSWPQLTVCLCACAGI